MLNLIAVGYSFGLAASVLWFGALGDRYGRKLLIVLGMALSIPVSLLAGVRDGATTSCSSRGWPEGSARAWRTRRRSR